MSKLYTFVVEGISDQGFPIDMLRYDVCWPQRYDDSTLIAALTVERGRETDALRRVSVRLTGMQEPTKARWQSFGWPVVQQREI